MAFGNWFSDAADLSRISSAFSAIWQNLLGRQIMWLGILPAKKRKPTTLWFLGTQKPPWRGWFGGRKGRRLLLASSHTSIGWLSHFVMVNHSLNIILKLGSKKKGWVPLCPGQCACGRKDSSDIKALLALIVHHKLSYLCASVSVLVGGSLQQGGRWTQHLPSLGRWSSAGENSGRGY